MKIILRKLPQRIRGHLLQNVEKGKPYEVIDTWTKHRKIIDDLGKAVWISGNVFREYFYEEKDYVQQD